MIVKSAETELKKLGERLLRLRLNKNMTQEALAHEAGVSLRTLIRLEQGETTQLDTFIKVLQSLGINENLDLLVPLVPASPIEQLKMKGKVRKRASTSHTKKAEKSWSWGDDQ